MSDVAVIGVAQEGKKFGVEELGIESNRQALIDAIATAPKASIIFVKRYEAKNGHGEVADYFYLKGVDYGAMKDRSLQQLAAMEADPNFALTVEWREWWDTVKDKKTTAAAKNKELRTHKVTYHAGDHRLTEAFAAVRNSILNPRERPDIYEKEGNGVYTQITDKGFCLHIRDCQRLHKTVVRHGDCPVKTTSESVALKDAITNRLPLGKYRQVRLDGRFDYVTVAGQIVMQDENGEQTFIGFKEHAGLMRTRIPQIDEEIEMEKTLRDSQHVIQAVDNML